MTFVQASGSCAVSLPTNTTTKVPIAARQGLLSAIDGGRFVCPTLGIWRFDLKAWGNGGQLRIVLLDDAGGEIEFCSYPGSSGPLVNNPIETTFAIIELAKGDKVWLASNQASGSTQVIAAEPCASRMVLHATYLG